MNINNSILKVSRGRFTSKKNKRKNSRGVDTGHSGGNPHYNFCNG